MTGEDITCKNQKSASHQQTVTAGTQAAFYSLSTGEPINLKGRGRRRSPLTSRFTTVQITF